MLVRFQPHFVYLETSDRFDHPHRNYRLLSLGVIWIGIGFFSTFLFLPRSQHHHPLLYDVHVMTTYTVYLVVNTDRWALAMQDTVE